MNKPYRGGLIIGLIAGITMLFSLEALIYYVRWFIPFLAGRHSYIASSAKLPALWFIIKILSNAIFLLVGILLFRLFRKFRQSGYFGKESLQVLDAVIISCLGLALLGFIQSICDNFSELHTGQWTSIWAIANCILRFLSRVIFYREPQTMYLLLGAILWAVRQFVEKALTVKKENESFI